MGKRLSGKQEYISSQRLSNRDKQFRIVFAHELQNGFELCDTTQHGIQEFHNFLKDTIYKNLTISQVDYLFLRRTGDAPRERFCERELLHYGKDSKKFRIFGYYNDDSYFVLCKIDCGHKTHQ